MKNKINKIKKIKKNKLLSVYLLFVFLCILMILCRIFDIFGCTGNDFLNYLFYCRVYYVLYFLCILLIIEYIVKYKLKGLLKGFLFLIITFIFVIFYEVVLNITMDNVVYKPILYLYPEKETKVRVDFEDESKLITTYPKFKDEWKISVKPNGDMDVDSKYYYALYWDEKMDENIKFDEGFYVDKENAISFLEDRLSYIGLNDRERNEFIMYWLPILEKNEHNLVKFILTDERQEQNELIIEPKPDSLLRVSIVIKKVDGKVNIKEQQLERFNRNGFVAVEWGGIVLEQ